MSSNILRLREQAVIVVEEDVAGVLKYPASGAPEILCTSLTVLQQNVEKMKSPEITSYTRGAIDVCQRNPSPGTWQIECLSRHSGLGNTPREANLMKGLLGTVTTVPATSVAYTPKMEKKTYTIWVKNGKKTTIAVGATASSYTETIGSECELRLMFSGEFMKLVWADESPLAAAVTTATVTVDDARQFSVGSLVQILDADGVTVIDDNSGAGFKILSVNYTANTVTLESTPSGGAIDDLVSSFVVSSTSGGVPIKAKFAEVNFGGTVLKTTGYSVTVNDNAQVITDEITTSGYPESFVEGEHEVTATINMYARPGESHYIYDALNNTDIVVALTAKNGTLERVTTLGRCKIQSYNISGSDPTISATVDLMAIDTVGLDSVEVSYE